MRVTIHSVVGGAGLVAAAAWFGVAGCNAVDGLIDVPEAGAETGGSPPGKMDAKSGADAKGADAKKEGSVHDAGHGKDGTSTVRDSGVDTAAEAAPPPADTGMDAPGMDAPKDVAVDHGIDAPPPAPPRQISPLSTSRVTNPTPTLKWEASPSAGVSGTTVQICSARSCTASAVISSTFVASGTTFKPTTALPAGVAYWRIHPGTDTHVSSPTWEFTVGTLAPDAGAATVDTSWGTTLDVNGDGCADFVVGADGSLTGGSGNAYVYTGNSTALPSSPAVTLTGPSNDSYFGTSAASAGDVNGDGYADLVVGAPNASTGSGAVYVYMGGPLGLSSTPAITLVGPAGTGSVFGTSVASAGDVNGDGYADVVVGAPGVSTYTGEVYVYFGGPSATVDGGLSLSLGWSLKGPGGTYSAFGQSVAGAGDINGDGYGDIVVGAYETGAESPSGTETGAAYVYLGGPLDGGTPTPITLPGASDELYLGYSVAGAGDVNGDGYADIIVGAYGTAPTSTAANTGSAYVYYGAHGQWTPTKSTTLAGLAKETQYGIAVAGAGDVDGDGYADIVVGAELANDDYGGVYIYLGSAAGATTTPAVDQAASITTATSGGALGSAVASVGNVTCGTYPGLIVGASESGTSPYGLAFLFVGGSSGLPDNQTSTLHPPTGAASFGSSVFGASN